MMVMVMTMTMINDNGDDGWEWHLASVNLRLSAWNLQQMGNRHQSHRKHHDDVGYDYDYEDDETQTQIFSSSESRPSINQKSARQT